jgi:AcrR family transcriptional regulator
MSPGNLYRYFPSKDAIVAGLAERDRSRVAQDFDAFETDDFMASFARLGRKHFHDEPRDKAVLCLEIWAESARNPAIAAMCGGVEQEVIRRLAEVLQDARTRGDIAADVDAQAAAVAIMTIGNGLFVRRAIAPDFDAEREVPVAIALIGAMLRGAVPLACAARAEETAS